jgi:hypothetical protein
MAADIPAVTVQVVKNLTARSMGVDVSSGENSVLEGRLNKFIFVGVTIGGATIVLGANAFTGTTVSNKVMTETIRTAESL